jgi:hypothetical protein
MLGQQGETLLERERQHITQTGSEGRVFQVPERPAQFG